MPSLPLLNERRAAELVADPVRVILDRELPWVTHGDLFSSQWLGIGPVLAQGWKLHVSATPQSAPEVLERAIPVLLRGGVRFKAVNALGELYAMNSGRLGPTQIGKFITVYPAGEAEAVDLATALDGRLAGLRGPRVPSDRPLRPGSLVHYRYGSFTGRVDGSSRPGGGGADAYDLVDADGRLTSDARLPFYRPPDGIDDPFVAAGASVAPPIRTGPLNGRYLIVAVLSASWRGGVYRAIDLGHPGHRTCVIKELWHDVGTDERGRDVRDWGAHEAELLRRHGSDPLIPKCFDRFVLDDNLYVVIEFVEGQSIDRELAGGLHASIAIDGSLLIDIARASARALAHFHDVGLIFRDVKPANLVHCPNGTYRFVDFGLAHDVHRDGHPVGAGTRLYCSPEQFAGQPPCPADDIFAWGAMLRDLAGSDLPPSLAAVIDRASARRPTDRFGSMAEVVDALTGVEVGVPGRTARRASAADHPVGEIDPVALAAEAATALCRDAEPFDGGLCWGVGQAAGWPPMYSPDLYDGTAGVVLALAAAAQATGEARFMDVAKAGAVWLNGRGWSRGRARHGLHCGEGGVGLVLLRLAQLAGEPGFVAAAELRARRLAGTPFTIEELFYGSSGTILFLVQLAAVTGDPGYLIEARTAGDELLAAAKPGPAGGRFWWVRPSDPAQLPEASLGLAHGAAGIGLALLELAAATGDERYRAGAVDAADMLLVAAQSGPDGGWQWPRTLDGEPITAATSGEAPQTHCHGAGGIGQFFARMVGHAPDARYEHGLRRAAETVAIHAHQRTSSGLCHGVAGDGMFFLDCYQALGDEQYLTAARRSLTRLAAFRDPDQPGVHRLAAGPMATPDLMRGYAGVALLAARLADPGRNVDLILPSAFHR